MEAQIASTSTPLPTELWTQIIQGLPSHTQRSCLSVSKLFHDISVRLVFASVTIRLGLVRDGFIADQDRWCNWCDESEEKTEAAIRRCCELLQHIAHSPDGSLAQAVRFVSVRAYSLLGGPPPSELMDTLEEALSILSLRGFAWYGCHPLPRREVFETLYASSGGTLEEIILPPELPDHTMIKGFRCLQSLSFLNRYDSSYKRPGADGEDPCSASMKQTIATTSLPLRSLGVFGHVLSQSNIQSVSTLVELSLALFTPGDPFGMVFTHCSQLRSLTLLVGRARVCDAATAFRTHANALPLLTAFQLSYPRMGPDMSWAMIDFLRNKTLLERLDLGHHRSSCAFDDIEPILDILPGLPRLRVFGAELSGSRMLMDTLTSDHLRHLAHRIPQGLTALSVWVDADRSTLKKEDWERFFAGLSSCRFIYVSAALSFPGSDALQSALLDHPPPLAEIVGFNVDIAWVERDPDTGRIGYSEKWPLSKVYNRTVGEFGCEEWEWLLRQADDRFG